MARQPEDNQPSERLVENDVESPISLWETYQFEDEYNVPPEIVKERRPKCKTSTVPAYYTSD